MLLKHDLVNTVPLVSLSWLLQQNQACLVIAITKMSIIFSTEEKTENYFLFQEDFMMSQISESLLFLWLTQTTNAKASEQRCSII